MQHTIIPYQKAFGYENPHPSLCYKLEKFINQKKDAPLIPFVDFKNTHIQTQAPLVKLMQKRDAWLMYNYIH